MQATLFSDIDISVGVSEMEMQGIDKMKLMERWQRGTKRKGSWFYRIKKSVGEEHCEGGDRMQEAVISSIEFGHIG